MRKTRKIIKNKSVPFLREPIYIRPSIEHGDDRIIIARWGEWLQQDFPLHTYIKKIQCIKIQCFDSVKESMRCCTVKQRKLNSVCVCVWGVMGFNGTTAALLRSTVRTPTPYPIDLST